MKFKQALYLETFLYSANPYEICMSFRSKKEMNLAHASFISIKEQPSISELIDTLGGIQYINNLF